MAGVNLSISKDLQSPPFRWLCFLTLITKTSEALRMLECTLPARKMPGIVLKQSPRSCVAGTTRNEAAVETEYGYDDTGNYVTSITNPLGNTVGLQVDARGNTKHVTDPHGNITSYEYDELDRIKTATAPLSPAHNASLRAKYEYDGNGNIKTVDYYRASGTEETRLTGLVYHYNELGLLKSVVDPVTLDGAVMNYQTLHYYDHSGNVSRIAYPNNHEVSYTYENGVDRLSRVIVSDRNSGGLQWDLQYDSKDITRGLDRLKSIKKFEGGVETSSITYGYDDITNSLKDVSVNNGTAVHDVAYGYSDVGNIVSITNSTQGFTANTSLTYADNGLVTVVNGPEGTRVEYLFDEAGRVIKARYSQNSTVTQTISAKYDDLGQLVELRSEDDEGAEVARSTYIRDGSGQILDEFRKDGSRVSYSYGAQNELLKVTYVSANGTKKAVSYQYDLFGNREKEIVTEGTVITSQNTYSYDAVGNRLVAVNGHSVITDQLGNVLQDDRHSYQYNGLNQLVSVTTSKGIVQYEYNLDGLRTKKTLEDGTVDHYHYNGSDLAYVSDGNNSLKYYFVRSSTGSLLYFIDYRSGVDQGQVYTYLRNGHGDVAGLTNSAGDVIGRYEYDAWGNTTSIEGNLELLNANPFRYASYFFDSETNLYYLKARYYDPAVGRFISKDELHGSPGDFHNLYAYADNNPANYFDPSGQWPEWLNKAAKSVWRFVDNVYGFSKAVDAGRRGDAWGTVKAAGSSIVKVAGTVAIGAAAIAVSPAVLAGGGALASGAGASMAAVAATTALHPAVATEAAHVLGTAAMAGVFSDGRNPAEVIGDSLAGGAAGQVMGWVATGKEFKVNNNLRIAPFGNRTGHPIGERPHYHHRIYDPNGRVIDGQGLKQHRPWEGGWR